MKMDFFFLKSLIDSSVLDCTLSLLPHGDAALTVPFVTQVHKFKPVKYMLGVTLRWNGCAITYLAPRRLLACLTLRYA